MISAFYKTNKITSSSIADTPDTSAGNRSRLVDSMIGFRYYGNATNSLTLTITLTDTIDSICLINSNLKTFTIKYDSAVDFSTPVTVTDSTKKHYYFEFDSQAVTSVTLTCTATHASDIPYIGYLFASEKIGEIFPMGVEAKLEQESLVSKMSSGHRSQVTLNQNYSFKVKSLIPTDIVNIWQVIMDDYMTRGYSVYYIHHWGDDPVTNFRGIAQQVIFAPKFQPGINYIKNEGAYTGLLTVKGTMIPASVGL